MAHPETSHMTHLYSNTTKQDPVLPTHHVCSTFGHRTSLIKSGPLRELIAWVALFAASCLSLYLYLNKYSVGLELFRTDSDSSVVFVGTNYTASTPSVADLHRLCDAALPAHGSALARRQTEGNKHWFFAPISSNRYHFRSRGQIGRSMFRVVPFQSSRDHLVVKVEVLRDPTGSALVSPSDDGDTYGIEISNEDQDNRGARSAPSFNVIVYIPIPNSQLSLNNFETELPGFEHIFPDLSRYVRFSRLGLSGINAPMTLGSQVADIMTIKNVKGTIKLGTMTAERVRVSNDNAPIIGKLTAAIELGVSNRNAEINGEYTLTSSGSIKITNFNSPISAQIRLKSGGTQSSLRYYIETSNANAPINLRVREQPPASDFFLEASNSRSPLRLRLSSAFEGHFDVQTSSGRPTVQVKNQQDPSGCGRSRNLKFDERGPKTSGRVLWGSPIDGVPRGSGEVTMSNSGGLAELLFD